MGLIGVGTARVLILQCRLMGLASWRRILISCLRIRQRLDMLIEGLVPKIIFSSERAPRLFP